MTDEIKPTESGLVYGEEGATGAPSQVGYYAEGEALQIDWRAAGGTAAEDAAAGLDAARKSLARQFGALVAAAKAGDVGAARKLQAFGSASDPSVGMRLALMNRAQRRALQSDARREARGTRPRKARR